MKIISLCKGLQRLVKVSSLDIIHDLDIACWGLTRGPGLVSSSGDLERKEETGNEETSVVG